MIRGVRVEVHQLAVRRGDPAVRPPRGTTTGARLNDPERLALSVLRDQAIGRTEVIRVERVQPTV